MSTAPQPDGNSSPAPGFVPQGPGATERERGPKHSELKVGMEDQHGYKVAEIYHRPESLDYTVYETTQRLLVIDGKGETKLVEDSAASLWISRFGDFAASTSKNKRTMFNRRAAQGFRLILDGKPKAGVKALKLTIQGMEQSLKRRGRLAYLVGGLATMLVLLLVVLCLYKFTYLNRTAFQIWLSLVLASMGGFMSLSIGINELTIDHRETFFANAFNGFLRLVIAMISGAVAYLLIESKIVFSFLGDQSTGSGYLIVAFLSGFSERFVPNLMKQWDSGPEGKAHAEPARSNVAVGSERDTEKIAAEIVKQRKRNTDSREDE
jgi:hypothetical protein